MGAVRVATVGALGSIVSAANAGTDIASIIAKAIMAVMIEFFLLLIT